MPAEETRGGRGLGKAPGLLESSVYREEPEAGQEERGSSGFGWGHPGERGGDLTLEGSRDPPQ